LRLPAGLAPLGESGFAWFYASRVVSTAGSTMAPIALAFAVLDVTDSASALGLVLAARTVPMVLFLLVGGVVSDRLPRALVMQTSNLLSAGTQAVVAALVISGHAELWSLMLLEAANGTVAAFSMPAMSGIVPQLAPRSQLQQANALLSFSRAGLTVIGPTVAALLVVGVGSGWALAVDAASWLVAALCISRVRLPATLDGVRDAGLLRELREGWSVFTGHTWLWVVVVGFGVMNAIHAGAWFTLGPALARDTFGARGWGLILSAESVGLLLATVVLLSVQMRRPLLSGMLGMALFAGALLTLGLEPRVAPLLVMAFLSGVGQEVFGMGWSLAMQENIDEAVLSRAYSYDALGSFVAMPVGQILYGPLGEAFGYRDVLVASGVVYLVVVVLVLSSRSVRTLPRAGLAEPTRS
jgi:MFS family permease